MNKKTLLFVAMLVGSSVGIMYGENQDMSQGLTPEQLQEIMAALESDPEMLKAFQEASAEDAEQLEEAAMDDAQEAAAQEAIAEEAEEKAEELAEQAVEEATEAVVLEEAANS